MKLSVILSALLLVTLAGCTKKSEDTIKIGVYGPFTGGSAPMGVSMRNGVQIAVDEINNSGGILGKKVAMIDRDDPDKVLETIFAADSATAKE